MSNINVFIKRVFVFSGIFYLLNMLVGELLMLKKEVMIEDRKFYPALTLTEFYNLNPNTIDVVYIGSSRAYSSFNPYLFDSITHFKSFNLGTSGQSPIASYFLLKEVFKYQKPSTVFIDISHEIIAKANDETVTSAYIFDEIPWCKNKFDFWLNGFDLKGKVILLFPSFRYRNNIYWLARNLLLNDDRIRDDGRYWDGKGYVGSRKSLSKVELLNPIHLKFDSLRINLKRLKYLKKVVEYALEKSSKVIFVYNPYPKVVLSNIENNTLFKYYQNIANELDVEFINTNNYQNIFNDTVDFRNMNHLNDSGAKKATNLISVLYE